MRMGEVKGRVGRKGEGIGGGVGKGGQGRGEEREGGGSEEERNGRGVIGEILQNGCNGEERMD